MKILVISNLYPPYYQGGYELRCREIVDGLSSMGHEVTVVASTYGVSSPHIDGNIYRVLRYTPDEVTEAMYRHKLTKPWTYLAAQLRLASIGRHNARAVQKVIESVQPDVAYVWNLCGLTISPLLPLVKEHIPRVFSLGDRWPIKAIQYYEGCSRVRGFIRKMLIGAGNHKHLLRDGLFLPNSNCLREECLAVGLPEDHVFVLPRGVRIPDQIPPLPESNIFQMLYAGRLCDNKGVRIALKAMSVLMADPNIKPFVLDIAGFGEEEYVSNIEKEINTLGLCKNVKLLGMLTWDELDRLRHNCHAFIFPSIWVDPFPVALLEAMASGLPVVGSPVGGAAEILENGVNSLTFPPGEHEVLTAAIKRLMDNPELAEKLREGGRRTVKERFDFNKLLGEHEKYLRLAIDRAKTSNV